MADRPIPARSEVPEESTWNLKDVFESNEAWQAEYEAFKAVPEQIEAFRGRLGESAETLLEWFRLNDALSVRLEKLYGYANCKGDEDTGNGFYQGMRAKALATLVAIDAASAFETPEIMALDEDTVNLFYAAQPELETYRRNIYKIRRRKAHILSPEEEKLLSAAGEMANGPENIASVFRDADLTFPAVTDGEGNERVLTSGTFVPLLMGSDRVLRKNAFEAYYNRFGEFKNTVAAALDGQFRSLKFFSDARHYPSTRAAALDVTEVPEEVYDNLIEAVHANMDKMYRYVALRKKLLGVDELHMYDVYTPIVADADSEITYEEAKATVLEAARGARRGLYRSSEGGLRQPLDRRLRKHRQARRRVFLRQQLPAPLRPAQPQGQSRQHVHARPRNGPRAAQLPQLQVSAGEYRRVRHLRGRGRFHLQRGAAHAPPARQDDRQEAARPISSTTSLTSSRARCTARRCSPSLRRSWAR